MFGQYFGNYLVENNIISRSQFDDLMKKQQSSHAKLGLIAVAEKLLTAKQAEEINELQKKMDRRFGDIAIEKGYLLSEEVTYLLNLQGNAYLKFVQALTDSNILSLEETEKYTSQYKKDNKLSESDMDAIKSGDIDRIIPVFVDIDTLIGNECISLTIRNIVRFVNSNIMLKKATKINSYEFGSLAYQDMIGDHQIFVGLAGKSDELLTVASPFAKEEFDKMSEDAFDSVCEFINCSNGLYASKLSLENVHIDMTPPLFSSSKTLTSKGDIYKVPILICGKQVDLLFVLNDEVEIN